MRFPVCCLLAASLVLMPVSASAAQPDGQAELRAALVELLRENPELIFDVLREHSDVLYDVAMQGREARILKDYQVQWTQDLTQPKQAELAGYPSRGPEDALVTMVVYSDFTCSYCQRAAVTLEQVIGAYGDDVRLVFKPRPHDPEGVHTSQRAADYFLAAFKADPAAAWRLYALLFSNQRALLEGGETYLQQLATDAGLDARALDRAASARDIQAMYASADEESARYKLSGTPCFLVNDLVILGAQPPEIFAAAIERALGEARRR